MSKLSTKDVPTSGEGGLPKTIEPGTQTLKINSVELKRFPFMEGGQGYYLMLNVETEPIDNFEGFLVDRDNENGPHYNGQVGQVKTNYFYYKNGQTKSGIQIYRDLEILKQVKNICISADCIKWFDEADGKYDTIEQFVEAFDKAGPFKDTFLNFTLGGKEYENNKGYTSYDLFIPKLKKGFVGYEAKDTPKSKLLPFNKDEQIIKKKVQSVDSFDADKSAPFNTPDADLAGAPEFEL
jgi:hypothetical protein